MVAFRKACFHSTTVSDSPLARAILMYSASSTSSRDERSSRTIPADMNHAMVTAGRMYDCHESMPLAGRRRSQTETTLMKQNGRREGGNRLPGDGRAHGQVVDPPAAPHGGGGAHGNPHDERDEERQRGQFGRVEQARDDDLQDRSAIRDRVAEVAGDHATEVDGVLLVERFVEAEQVNIGGALGRGRRHRQDDIGGIAAEVPGGKHKRHGDKERQDV